MDARPCSRDYGYQPLDRSELTERSSRASRQRAQPTELRAESHRERRSEPRHDSRSQRSDSGLKRRGGRWPEPPTSPVGSSHATAREGRRKWGMEHRDPGVAKAEEATANRSTHPVGGRTVLSYSNKGPIMDSFQRRRDFSGWNAAQELGYHDTSQHWEGPLRAIDSIGPLFGRPRTVAERREWTAAELRPSAAQR